MGDTTQIEVPVTVAGKITAMAARAGFTRQQAADTLLAQIVGNLQRVVSGNILLHRGALPVTQKRMDGEVVPLQVDKALAHRLGQYARALEMSRNWLFYYTVLDVLPQYEALDGFDRNTLAGTVRAQLGEAEKDVTRREQAEAARAKEGGGT